MDGFTRRRLAHRKPRPDRVGDLDDARRHRLNAFTQGMFDAWVACVAFHEFCAIFLASTRNFAYPWSARYSKLLRYDCGPRCGIRPSCLRRGEEIGSFATWSPPDTFRLLICPLVAFIWAARSQLMMSRALPILGVGDGVVFRVVPFSKTKVSGELCVFCYYLFVQSAAIKDLWHGIRDLPFTVGVASLIEVGVACRVCVVLVLSFADGRALRAMMELVMEPLSGLIQQLSASRSRFVVLCIIFLNSVGLVCDPASSPTAVHGAVKQRGCRSKLRCSLALRSQPL